MHSLYIFQKLYRAPARAPYDNWRSYAACARCCRQGARELPNFNFQTPATHSTISGVRAGNQHVHAEVRTMMIHSLNVNTQKRRRKEKHAMPCDTHTFSSDRPDGATFPPGSFHFHRANSATRSRAARRHQSGTYEAEASALHAAGASNGPGNPCAPIPSR